MTEHDRRADLLWMRQFGRRRFLAGSAAGALALALAACGGDDGDDDTSPTSTGTGTPETTGTATATSEPEATQSPEASGSEGYPRSVEHELGTVELPAYPERIVSVTENEPLDSLLQLGVAPVLYGLVGGYIGRLPEWVAPLAEGVESYEGARGEPDLELIASKQPDLILNLWCEGDQYEALSQIAPTASVKESDATTWQEVHRTVARMVGKEELAEEQIAEVEALFPAEAERLESYRDLTVAVAYEFFGELFIHGEDAPIAKIVKALGMELVAPDANMAESLSVERWGDVSAADIIISPAFFEDHIDEQALNPLFAALPAATNGQWVVTDPELSQAGYLESPLSLHWAIPRIADAIIAAAEGEGRIAGG